MNAPFDPADLTEGASARTPWQAFDELPSLVAVIDAAGHCMHVNAACEDRFGVPRRSLVGARVADWFTDGATFTATLASVAKNEYATGRLQATLQRDAVPVHIVVHAMPHHGTVLVEMIELEQHWRQMQDEHALDQARETKALVRHLAHEIKNPLGGIRGAAQLLGMELSEGDHPRALRDYARVIVNEADRLQVLVDKLLAPHRVPHVVGDVNIHEVCERVRSLLLAEFPKGLVVARDYDASIPEFRGDTAQLIQVVLNMGHNAALALTERVHAGDARIVLRTRVARQVTIGKRRWRLALDLQVEDNGPGIATELQSRVFMPLVSGREGGTGLGLTLAQHFVQLHDGLIALESRPGRTVFKTLIPLP